MTDVSALILVAATLLSATLSRVLVSFAASFSRQSGMIDVPGPRQSHVEPTPTGGGIGIVVSLIVTSIAFAQFGFVSRAWTMLVIPGLLLLSLLGWLDDRNSLPAPLRFLVQWAVSLGLLSFSTIELSVAGIPGMTGQIDGWLLMLAGSIAVVWTMNAYNFMDGSHGMAGFQGVFSGAVLGLVLFHGGDVQLAVPAFLLAGCCLGFLPLNFPFPRVFMGDAGSVPIGFAIAGLAILGLEQNMLTLPVILLVLSVFFVDTTLTLLSRAIRGERWYTAHRKHVYQRLIASGWPHSRVLLLYQAINVILVIPVVILVMMYPEYAWTLTGLMFLLLISGWFLASRRLGVRK